MPLALPPELKKVTPYIRRAEELDRDNSHAESRLVAYYCRQYAVLVGIPLAVSPGAKTALGNILNDLEKEKASMSNFTREESQFLCQEFAYKIFAKADAQDRAGAANKDTAKTFYAAASFLEMLQQFEDGDEDEERKKKIVYAKWKATEILKAIQQGKQPVPGGYGEGPPLQEEDDEEAAPVVAPPEVPAPVVVAPQVPAPLVPPPTPVPIAPPNDDNEGTEVELGPPPAYPGPETNRNNDDAQVFIPPAPTAPMPPPVSTPWTSVS